MEVAASVLSLDYSDTKSQLALVNENLKYLHFDVMDGHFTPNLTFGPDILKAFKKSTNCIMDVHIMVNDPEFISTIFVKDADIITFHFEACESEEKIRKIIKYLHNNNVKAGLSINPATDVKAVVPYLKDLDLVLVMSVVPGFGGQGFIESSLEKLEFLKEYKKENNLSYIIEVDGGVKGDNAEKIAKAGAELAVSGSYLFKGDFKQNVESLKKY